MEESNLEILICHCSSLEHQVAFEYDEESKLVYLRPKLITHKNFFMRLRHAIRYILGYKSKFGEFDEIILKEEDVLKLKSLNK